MKIEIRNVKVNKSMSEETACFSAQIYVDGKPVGHVANRGTGGANEYHLTRRDLQQQMEDYVKATFDYDAYNRSMNEFLATENPLTPDCKYFEYLDHFIGELLEQHAEMTFLRRHCKKNVVFRVKGAKKGEWQSYKIPASVVGNPQALAAFLVQEKEYLAKKYPDLEEVANDRF